MRIACKVKWLDDDISDCVLLANTISYSDGFLRIYLVKCDDYFYTVELSAYVFHSIKRQLVEEGFSYINKPSVSETLWREEILEGGN